MNIRPASLQDIDGIFEYAKAGTKRYPALKPDFHKIRSGITEAISAAKHFCWVAEKEGVIHGVLIGLTGENMWAQRQFCSIPLWVSSYPGTGVQLLRKFTEWVKSRRAVKVAGFAPDVDLSDRTLKIMELLGFKRNGGAYLLYN